MNLAHVLWARLRAMDFAIALCMRCGPGCVSWSLPLCLLFELVQEDWIAGLACIVSKALHDACAFVLLRIALLAFLALFVLLILFAT